MTATNEPLTESQAEHWAETLTAVCQELECLNRDTEKEFLKTGQSVSEFIETVDLLSSELAGLGGMISGELGRQAAEALNEALNLSTEMNARSSGSNRVLGQMYLEASRVKHTLAGFRGTVATFHSLGLLTRIETARLGNAGADFGNLAEEVRLLARNVQTRVESALDTAGELIPQIELGLKEVSALQEGQMQSLPGVVSQVMESLSAFREMQSRAQQASVRLAAEYKKISEAFTSLIISMQFNDITRQQVEHVIESLLRLSSPSGNEDGSLLLEQGQASAVLELQASQLANGRQTFDSSVKAVLQSLDDIAAHVAGMVEESQVLASVSGNEKNSFFGQMERGCSAILTSLNACTNADSAAAATSQDLAEKIARMRAAIEEIRDIETQMKRIAMNARISAMHLGSSGEALSALADSIKQRAFESRQGSDSLVVALDLMTQVAQNWNAQSQQSQHEKEIRDACLTDMETAIARLRASHTASSGQIEKIMVRAEDLCRDVLSARQNFRVSERFDEVVQRAGRKLAVIVEELRVRGPVSGGEQLNLADFAGRYTMNAERDVYSKAAGTSQDQSTEDNIEFF